MTLSLIAVLAIIVPLSCYCFYRAAGSEWPTRRKDITLGLLMLFGLLAFGAIAVFLLQLPTD